jgi:AraC-like DNA-binding protein
MSAVPALNVKESRPSLERGSFGDLEEDGFRITRWDASAPCAPLAIEADTLVLCLNVAGGGEFHAGEHVTCVVEAGSLVLSTARSARSEFVRDTGGRHRFLVVEMSRAWLGRWLAVDPDVLREPVGRFLRPGKRSEPVCEVHAMTAQLAQLAAEILQPPRVEAAWNCWHQAKVLELVAHAMFLDADADLFCDRTKRAGRERILRVQEILQGDLENPPSLAELGKMVGCSPFYLSRMFRQETGVTISAYLRRLRLDRAAELIRAGEANVTEAAMAVGYSSLSHFSKAFAETFGCCPCLYGRKG